MRNLIFSIGLLLSLLITPATALSDYIVSTDTPDWFLETFYDFPEEVKEAAQANKRIMIYFGQDGCPYCEKLHNDSFHQTSIVKKLNEHFGAIAINIFGDVDVTWVDGKNYTEKELAKKLNIQFTPSLMFLDEQGTAILTIAGYQPPQKLVAIADYVLNKRETEQPFSDYIRAYQKSVVAEPISISYPDTFLAPPFTTTTNSDKKRAILVVQDNCQFCVEWQTFLNSDKAKPWRNQFEMVQYNINNKAITIDKTISESDWAKQNQLAFVPALLFFNTDGSEITRVDGYLRAFHLESILDYVASDAYKTEPEFQRFIQARADHLREQGKEVIIW